MNYSKEYKDSILRRMLPPNSESKESPSRRFGTGRREPGRMDMPPLAHKRSRRIGAPRTSS